VTVKLHVQVVHHRKDIECVYEVSIRQSKGHMRSQIEELRAYQQQSERLSQIISRLRIGESLKNVSDNLKKPSQAPRENITTYPGLSDHQAIDAAIRPARGIMTSQFTNLRLEEAQGLTSAIQQAEDETTWSSLLGPNNMTDSMAGTNDDLMSWAPDPFQFLIP
jgi:DNA-binding transcriptional MerR regulator